MSFGTVVQVEKRGKVDVAKTTSKKASLFIKNQNDKSKRTSLRVQVRKVI